MGLLNLEGRVIDVKYTTPNISIVIDRKRKKPLQVTLPIKLHNEVELIPYQLALLEQQVKYTTTTRRVQNIKRSELDYDFFEATFCELKILTGILKGRYYTSRL